MTVVEIPSGTHDTASLLGGRFRLDERISLEDQVSSPCGSSWEARGLSLWKATDQLLGRPVTIYLLPRGIPVPRPVVDAVQSAARVTDARITKVYDTDFSPQCPYIVAEWTPGTHLEDLLRSGLPTPALAAAMIADAADAIAVAHRAGRPHLRLTPRALRWHPGSGLKVTGFGIDAALCGPLDPGVPNPMAADTMALARMLYALLTGYWPGDEPTGLPPAPRHKGQVCTPRQVRAGVPAALDAITYRALQGLAADAPLRAQTPAGLAMALSMVQRPSRLLGAPEDGTSENDEAADGPGMAGVSGVTPIRPARRARHARARTGHAISTLLRPA
jgi:serine/threonine protein kinase